MIQHQLLSGRQGCNVAIELWPELAQQGYRSCAKNPKYRIAEGKFSKPRRLGKPSVWTKEDIEQWREQWLEGVQ
jgi:hypothetical protein